jgi:hypothetical protein
MRIDLPLAVLIVALAASPSLAEPASPAAGELAPIDQRFSPADVTEEASFQRHVLPLMGRLGCNGRACHGSFQGRGGFRLSLFGYDFATDREALAGGEKPRVNVNDPRASLILNKPTDENEHEGGERFKKDGWEYRVFHSWIQAGAKNDSNLDVTLTRLEVTPSEIIFSKDGESTALRAVAHWSDGSREDVTPICRFQTNDGAVASITESGKVISTGLGDTHVVVFYDNGITPVPVLRPVSAQAAANYPQVPTPTRIDELVVEKLRKLGVVPSDLCTDAEFLRRASLDLTGTLPPAGEVAAFAADSSPNKRQEKIDELMSRPTYAAWWTTRLCDITGNSAQGLGNNAFRNEESRQWYEWIYDRVEQNVPYDEIVAGIALATSRKPDQSFEEYCAEMGKYYRPNDPASFGEHPTMPHYWSRRTLRMPEERALAFAYTFLGVRLQCAQCHKHPFDQWSQHDFQQFTAFFNGITYGTRTEDRAALEKMNESLGLGARPDNNARRMLPELLSKGKTIPFTEVYVSSRGGPTRTPGQRTSTAGRVITPRVLGGEEVLLSRYNDPREAVMEWMRDKDNPYFARALVNRVWANYFNVGIVEPADDQNLANPPSNAPLLDWLTEEFVAHGYDLKWLHRTITGSRTYQLSWQPNETNRHDERNFSRAVPRRLPAEVVYDALRAATASDKDAAAMIDDVSQRAIGPTGGYLQQGGRTSYALATFGKPARATNCDCERSSEPSLLQTLYLRNDDETLLLVERAGGWVDQAVRQRKGNLDDAALAGLVRDAYLRTVSRMPSEAEAGNALEYVRKAPGTAAGLRDLVWALINTKEFVVNH